jgi:hypothetical protein
VSREEIVACCENAKMLRWASRTFHQAGRDLHVVLPVKVGIVFAARLRGGGCGRVHCPGRKNRQVTRPARWSVAERGGARQAQRERRYHAEGAEERHRSASARASAGALLPRSWAGSATAWPFLFASTSARSQAALARRGLKRNASTKRLYTGVCSAAQESAQARLRRSKPR